MFVEEKNVSGRRREHFISIAVIVRSWDSSVGIVTGYGLKGREVGV
jgi:hypothetical protein